MPVRIYNGVQEIGCVSTSGEVFRGQSKVGWVNGDGNIYQDGIRMGWVTRMGTVIDRESNRVGQVDAGGCVYRGATLVGRVECADNRYCQGGAALLLLLGHFNARPVDASSLSVGAHST
jgi:hypothetical protein